MIIDLLSSAARRERTAVALSLASLLMLAGCIPEESPVAPYDHGPVRTQTFAMGQEYASQIYFDLESGTIVQSSPCDNYDLEFLSDPASDYVLLNSATVSAAADLGAVPFETAVSTAGANWQSDRSTGDLDSTALGIWWQTKDGHLPGAAVATRGHLYLIDRGHNAAAKRRGYVKLMLLGADSAGYRIRFSDVDGTNDRTVTVARDAARIHTGFSFDGGGTPVAIEPPGESWDIVLTRYTYIFYDPGYIPYSVTGALLNPRAAGAALDSTLKFSAVTRSDTARFRFSNALDIVGYSWKSYDINAGKYTVDPQRTYIVRRDNGLLFKLRFVEFYSETGEKGFPRMEWQKL